ncbi:MAG: hypothetical protein CMP10_19635 [Zetaproteobacteria bacterium]|nr:hypothetical protein [Pseudobdellovibrionaceae bacterium]
MKVELSMTFKAKMRMQMKFLSCLMITTVLLTSCKPEVEDSATNASCLPLLDRFFKPSVVTAQDIDAEIGFLRFLRRGWIEDQFAFGMLESGRIRNARSIALEIHMNKVLAAAKKMKLPYRSEIQSMFNIRSGSPLRQYILALDKADRRIQESIVTQAQAFKKNADMLPSFKKFEDDFLNFVSDRKVSQSPLSTKIRKLLESELKRSGLLDKVLLSNRLIVRVSTDDAGGAIRVQLASFDILKQGELDLEGQVFLDFIPGHNSNFLSRFDEILVESNANTPNHGPVIPLHFSNFLDNTPEIKLWLTKREVDGLIVKMDHPPLDHERKVTFAIEGED